MKRLKDGFTLIELLVVISIILIVSSIIFIGGNAGSGAALSSSTRIVSSVAQGARGQAILRNTETRLIIHNNPTDLDKFGRFIGVVYWGEDDTGAEGWLAATQGIFLSKGVYFDPTLVSPVHDDLMNLDYPRITVGLNTNRATGGGSVSYYYYAFNSNGTSTNVNEWLAIRAGYLNLDGLLEPYDPNGEFAGLKAALIFRRAGTTTLVTNPEDVVD